MDTRRKLAKRRSFRDVIRRRLNWKASGGWALLLTSAAKGAWEMLEAAAQIETLARWALTVWPYLVAPGKALWSYGWVLGIPAGFYWLYRADQPLASGTAPTLSFSWEERHRRQRIAELLPHLPDDALEALMRFVDGPQIFNIDDRFGRAYVKPILSNDLLVLVDDSLGGFKEGLYKIHPLYHDVVADFLGQWSASDA